MLRLRYFLPAVALAASFSLPGRAAENWSLCSVPGFVYVQADDLAEGETRAEADDVTSRTDESLRLLGDVSLTRRQQKLTADDVLLDKSNDRIEAQGNVLLEDPNYRLESPRMTIDNRDNTARIESPRFELPGRHASGEASLITRLDVFRSRFEDLEYTSCDPGDRDWHLRAAEMEINYASGRGTARHARLYFQEVPFAYLPYFQFPVDDRRMSGLLTPSLGYDDDNGGSLLLPVYWNMAPNYDMTITPAWYGKRGLQLNTENRYLFESQRGQLDLSYLDDDETGDSRWYRQWRHDMEMAFGVHGDLLLAEVSDGDIFDDFDRVAPQYNNTRHLERRVRFDRGGNIWDGELMWQDYETLNPDIAIEDRPYNRLPSFRLAASPPPWRGGFETPLAFEATAFDRDDSVTGTRSHLVAAARWTARRSWYFFQPALQVAFTDYSLEDNLGDDSIDRALPTASLDTGLIFERPAGSGGKWTQTLEPRLFFLHTPFEEQDDIPDFDTSLNNNTYANLFRNNRFSGADRIGDASQVTLGLASRLYDSGSGNQLMDLRVGQIFYFKDRRVSLDGQREDEPRSDAIGEMDLWPNQRTRIGARLVYGQEEQDFNDGDLSVNFIDDGLAANLAYYYTEDELEQALVSVAWPVDERWAVVAKYHRSLRYDEVVENLLGFSYESCCWGLKILAGQSGDEDENFADTDNSIYLELTLKGLSAAGDDIDSRLAEAIPGYRETF